MVNETLIPDVTPDVGAWYWFSISVFATATIDWTTYRFPQPIDLSGMPDKFGGGVNFSRWQKKMKLWLTVKGLWPVVQYEKPVLNKEMLTLLRLMQCGKKRMGWLGQPFWQL